MHSAYGTKCIKAGRNDTGRRQYKRHSKPKTLTEEEVSRCERMEAEDAYRKHLLKALAARRGVEESELRAGDVDCVFGRKKLLREIMATIKGVDPDKLSWDEVEKEFQRKNNAGGEYGEGLDAENEELCEEVNKLRAELAYLEKYPGEDEVYWTDYCSCDEYGYDSDSDW